MKTKEIINYLEKAMPEQVDYAEMVGAPASSYGIKFVYENEYDYVCEEAIEKLNKLESLEALEEQGLLIKLPCKVGDNIYVIKNACGDSRMCDDCINSYNCNGRTDYSVYDGIVKNIEISPQIYISVGGKYLNILFNANKFGKTLFSTKESAEEKLKKMKG